MLAEVELSWGCDNIWNVKMTNIRLFIMINAREEGGGEDGKGRELPCKTIFPFAGLIV